MEIIKENKALESVVANAEITFDGLPNFINNKWVVRFKLDFIAKNIVDALDGHFDENDVDILLDEWHREGTHTQAHTDPEYKRTLVHAWSKEYYHPDDSSKIINKESVGFEKELWFRLNTELYYSDFVEGKRWVDKKYCELELIQY